MSAYANIPDRPPEMADREHLLLVAAVLLHGPVDVLLTAPAYHLESNPVVLELGLGLTTFVKAVALTGLVLTYRASEPHPLRWVPLAVLGLLGVVLILPNLPLMILSG